MFIKNYKSRITTLTLAFCLFTLAFGLANGQEQPPEPLSPRAVKIPKIVQSKLPNGMNIVVAENKNVPLVSVTLLIDSGAQSDDDKLAGVTNMTASLLTKGTTTRSADAIAEQMEFLGSSIGANASWMNTTVGFNSTTDKLDSAMAIFADVVLHPTFPQKEIDLLKSQTIDELATNLKQPGTLARYVAAQYSFGEHSVSGTPETINAIKRKDLLAVYKESYRSDNSTLIFTGDITKAKAITLAKKFFGIWKYPVPPRIQTVAATTAGRITFQEYRELLMEKQLLNRMLVVDLPNSGQAAVVYTKNMSDDNDLGLRYEVAAIRDRNSYYAASVANSILGGGYSSRMNQEIRIKRGLSYGAGSGIAWRWGGGNFSTRCQTKTVSAAEVAELTIAEINRLVNENAPDAEITPRKNVLNGDFGRRFETNDGISNQIEELLTFGLETKELDSFMSNTDKVTAKQVKDFALFNLKGGDLIIVGDYNDFKDDLAKRFPNQKIEVIKESELNLNSETLRK